MTVIAYKDGVLATGSRTVSGWLILTDRWKKITKLRGGIYVAGVGESALIVRYIEWLRQGRVGNPPSLANAKGEENSALLVCFPDGRAEYHDNGAFYEVQTPYVMGCGREIALGAMLAGKSAIEAVELAITRCAGCGGEVQSQIVVSQ